MACMYCHLLRSGQGALASKIICYDTTLSHPTIISDVEMSEIGK